MSRTISSSVSSGISLTSGDDPVTITATGTIDTATGTYALLGGGAYTITNSGHIVNTYALGSGIRLTNGGTVNNVAPAATIAGAGTGVYIGGQAGGVSNTGTIKATGTSGVTAGVNLAAGGSVINHQHGVIAGDRYGVYANGGATITNLGSIAGTGAASGRGVALTTGGIVSNRFGGAISGGLAGVVGISGYAVVSNSGTIAGTGTAAAGVVLNGGGSVTNTIGGLIDGTGRGVYVTGTTGVVTNNGVIDGTLTLGVYLSRGGTVTNGASGTIAGGQIGVEINFGEGTVANAGVISGSTAAVSFRAGYANVLSVSPGASFNGLVDGGNPVTGQTRSTLALGSGATAGTLTGFGSGIIDFGNVTFAAGTPWLLSGNAAGIAGGAIFSGFGQGDTLQIQGLSHETIAGFSNGTLTLTGDAALSVIFASPAAGGFQVATDTVNSNAVDITLPCFAKGTRLMTDNGEVAVEDLKEGDRLVTVLGGIAAPIVWKGFRHLRPRLHRNPTRVQPIRIRAGAFGAGKPNVDIWLSPDHAIYDGGVLVPVRLLVNGSYIVQEAVDEITYFHVELAEHDVILASGLACESYLNTGDRSAFENGGGPIALHPDFSGLRWEGSACAELVVTGERLARVRAKVKGRVRQAA